MYKALLCLALMLVAWEGAQNQGRQQGRSFVDDPSRVQAHTLGKLTSWTPVNLPNLDYAARHASKVDPHQAPCILECIQAHAWKLAGHFRPKLLPEIDNVGLIAVDKLLLCKAAVHARC